MSYQNHRFRSITAKILALLCACVFLLTPATPTQALPTAQTTPAFPQAFFHTQSLGNQGTDVIAIQYLLSISPSGKFDTATYNAVYNFQVAWGLNRDGIVGPATWNRLIVTLRQGNSGNPVRAVQILLNEKQNARLLVNGIFDSYTHNAVRNFEAHAGLPQDGITDPTMWKNLIWHYERIDFTKSSMCEIATTNGDAKWGTAAAVAQIEAAATAIFNAGYGPLPIEELSFEHGGDIPGHGSHEVGLDVDIRPITTDGQQCRFKTHQDDPYYAQEKTRQLIYKIRENADAHVKIIWFNDDNFNQEKLTYPLAEHDDHLHVRYCEKVHPDLDPERTYTC